MGTQEVAGRPAQASHLFTLRMWPEEMGGGGESITLTAGGKTKTVTAINTDVPALRTLLAKIRALLK